MLENLFLQHLLLPFHKRVKCQALSMEDEGGRSSKDRGRKQKSIFSKEKMPL